MRPSLFVLLAMAGCAAEHPAPAIVERAKLVSDPAPPAPVESSASSDAESAPPESAAMPEAAAPPPIESATLPPASSRPLADAELRTAARHIALCDACSGMCDEACDALHALEHAAARLCARHAADCPEAKSLLREARAHYGRRCAGP